MVDKLRGAREGLEPPICPACSVQMKWVRSQLIEPDSTVIVHLFLCPTCERTEATKSFSKPADVPRGKLSAPRRRLKAAQADLSESCAIAHGRAASARA